MQQLKKQLEEFKTMVDNADTSIQSIEKLDEVKHKYLRSVSSKILDAFNFVLSEIQSKETIKCTPDDFFVFQDIAKEIKKLKKIRKRFILLAGKNSEFSQQLRKKNLGVIY